MRVWGRLLAVKARAEIATGRYDDAIRTISTGLAFARHVAQAQFYINGLVGLAIANLMLDRVDELSGRPDAPNLYWALTALPRPLISLREATETERAVCEGMAPELTEAERARSDADWAALLARLHARMVSLEKLLWPERPRPNATPGDLASFKSAMLPKARAYLEARDAPVKSDDQALVLAIVGSYREVYDEYFKSFYVPYPQALLLEREVDSRVVASKAGPAAVFTGMLPAVMSAHLAEVRVERKVAAQRILAAFRLHAARHDGRLPASLDELNDLPIPPDPMTGKPFDYRREANTAVLTGTASQAFRLVYRLTLAK
jgi:hypothetical protein